MKKPLALLAIIIGLALVAGCTQPTAQPSVRPTGQPASPTISASQTPTVQATPTPAIAQFPSDYRHSLYGYFMDTSYIQTTRPADWRGKPIQAAGEVYVKTRANDTQYSGYMQADGSYLVDGIPTGNDVKVISVKLYRASGTDLMINVDSEWQTFNEVAQRTRLDIG